MRSIDDIRKYIRKSIRQQVKEARNVLAQPPRDFSDFRRRMAYALSDAGVHPDFVTEALEEKHAGSDVFGAIYGTWMGIESEMKNAVTLSERQEAWCLSEGMLSDCVLEILSGRTDEHRAKKISSTVVESLIRKNR